jgi:hypothetical protein
MSLGSPHVTACHLGKLSHCTQETILPSLWVYFYFYLCVCVALMEPRVNALPSPEPHPTPALLSFYTLDV